jgi:AraC-like DNA-binding protein
VHKDAISELLLGVKLSGAMFFNGEFSAPWGVDSPGSEVLAPVLSPGAKHLVVYHYVVDGRAVAQLAGGPACELEAGDVVVFPHGDRHFLSNGEVTVGAEEALDSLRRIQSRDLRLLRMGGGGERTRLVCGFMACDPYLGRPILGGLPPLFKVNVRKDASATWLESAILHLVDETPSGRVGSEALLAKLSEALFVEVLRRYVAELPAQQTGWLAGARDEVVGRSLGLLHHRVEHPWTIAELAKEVGVSRSGLVERFTKYLSEPPMTYLARWRLQLAAQRLAETSQCVAEIALGVGYESEAAFHRAFKREFGVPPARYRRASRADRMVAPPIAAQS